jgi:hypothetical protein
MFNKGALWSGFLSEMQETLLARLPEKPVVVEIGHGDGSFIAALAAKRPGGRFHGFDPNGAAVGDGSVALHAELFDPGRHLAGLRPDLIISRHVMEHLSNPLGFLQHLCFAAAHAGSDCLLYLEVPCIDRVIETGRTIDFYYEHSSQFTTGSFSRMLMRCAAVVETIGHGYDGEVIYGLARMSGSQGQVKLAEEAARYDAGTRLADQVIRSQLMALHASGRPVAIWGGTGKSAAFMNRYGVDAMRFPIIVASDPAKVGTFVPGTGQAIRGREHLREHPVDVVIVPPQWRAADIVLEMTRAGIVAETSSMAGSSSITSTTATPIAGSTSRRRGRRRRRLLKPPPLCVAQPAARAVAEGAATPTTSRPTRRRFFATSHDTTGAKKDPAPSRGRRRGSTSLDERIA